MTTQKFGRNYRLTIDPADGQGNIVVAMPFTINIYVQRNNLASLNIFSVEIYNLGKATRRRIFQDFYDYQQVSINGENLGWRSVLLEAGYGTNLKTIFSGAVFRASSARSGTEIATRIEGNSGSQDINTTMIYETFAAGQTYAQLFRYLISKFPTLTVGYIGNWPQVFVKPVVLNGRAWDILRTYSNNRVYIDNGQVNILNDNEQLNLPPYLINDASGILQTPRRDQQNLVITMLFEPGVQVNQAVTVNSSIEPVYNGTYNVIGINHDGVISGAVSGYLRTTLTLFAPGQFKYTKVAQG